MAALGLFINKGQVIAEGTTCRMEVILLEVIRIDGWRAARLGGWGEGPV